MNKPPRWHKDAPAPKRPDRPLWASHAPAADRYDSDPRDPNSVHALPMYDPYEPNGLYPRECLPDIIMPDETTFDFNTLPQGTHDAKLTTKGAEKIIAGLEKKFNPKRCIAADKPPSRAPAKPAKHKNKRRAAYHEAPDAGLKRFLKCK